ncbi:hypothetical protein Tco_0949510, partial [Tanacetum coccineum]
MKRVGKGFSGRETPLFPTMVVQNQAEMGEGGDPRRQETMRDTIAQTRSENVSKFSNDPLLVRVIDLENTKTAQAQEITSLKLRVKKLEKKGGSRTHKLKILYKVGRSVRIVSSGEASLDVLDGDEVSAKPEVTVKDVNLSVDEVTLAQALVALKSVKVHKKANVVEEPSESITTTPTLTTTTAATTITAVSTRPRAKGLVIHKEEQATTPTVSSQQPSQLKVRDKVEFDEEVRFTREKVKKEEEVNIIAWDNVQAMIDVDYQMPQQMQAEEQEELSIEEKSKLFVQLLEA